MVEIKENVQCFQYMFFYIFIIISFIYLRLLAKNIPSEDDINFFLKVIEYWKKKPIWKMHFEQIQSEEEPKDMEKYSFGTWPGMYEGCNCSYSSSSFYLYYKGVCSQKNLSNNCNGVEEQDPVKIYNYNYKFFVTYYDSDYLTLLSRVEKKNGEYKCKEGFKKCGLLDSSGVRPFCVKENEDCVINFFYFKKISIFILAYFGFDENITETYFVTNNLFLTDSDGCILDEDYFVDDFKLFKNKTNKLVKCKPGKSRDIYSYVSNSYMYKKDIYTANNIYKGFEKIPDGNSYINMYSMIYYGLNETFDTYYYADANVLENLKVFNILIFIILKVGIQLGYFIFLNKVAFKDKMKEIICNGIWACVFIAYLILIWLFNNSVYRSGLLVSAESGDNLCKIMEKLRIIDIIMAFMIVVAQIIKLVNIINNKGIKKYSEFINKDK